MKDSRLDKCPQCGKTSIEERTHCSDTCFRKTISLEHAMLTILQAVANGTLSPEIALISVMREIESAKIPLNRTGHAQNMDGPNYIIIKTV